MCNVQSTGKVLGIDLGTTNSIAAIFESGHATVIPTAEGPTIAGKCVFPSVVAFTKDGQLLVGLSAKFQATNNSEGTIFEIKRKMGTDYKANVYGKEYSPQQISAFILQKIKKDTETYLGGTIRKAVITVPAHFNDNQRQATKDAGEIAGFQVMRIINEPTAACLAYGIDKVQQEMKILVFSFGGGTHAVTVMGFRKGVFQVLSTSSDTLGGTEVDKAIMEYVAEEFKRQTGVDVTSDQLASARLKEAAEKAKIELTVLMTTDIDLHFQNPASTRLQHLHLTLTRTKLESLAQPIVQKTERTILQALEDAKLTPQGIDKIILVGGMSRMPLVQRFVERVLGKAPERGLDPMECVAIGASIQAAVITGEVTDLLLQDITPLSLGIESMRGFMVKIIPRNTVIPIRKSILFCTAEDFQSAATIHVLQGERPMAVDNFSLGKFNLEGITPARIGEIRIEVTFDIDSNGILTVMAKDCVSGKEAKIRITASTKLSKEEKEHMIKEDEQFARALTISSDIGALFSPYYAAEKVCRQLLCDVYTRFDQNKGVKENSDNEIGSKRIKEVLEIQKLFKIKSIHEGGFGRVYIVSTLGYPTFAMKTYKNENVFDKIAIDMFVREAFAWIKLGRHKNIVTAYNVQRIGAKLFILMEYMDGGTLRDYIVSSVSNISKIIDFALQICEGMDYAYRKLNLVHRDLKPENVLLTLAGVAKIADFGLVKAFDHLPGIVEGKPQVMSGVFKSAMGAVAGTPQYMSPEQFRAPKYVDTRSDIYSFGVMFYEMLTGKRPFVANTFSEYEAKHLDDKPINPMLINSKIPKELCSIVMKCMEKYPEKRYQTFHDLKNDIKTVYEKLGEHYLEPEVTGLLTAFDLTFDGFLIANLNEFEDAANCFDTAINIDAEYALSWVGKGATFLKNRKISDASYCFCKASKLDQGLSIICESFTGLARCLEPRMKCIDCGTNCLEIKTNGYPRSIHEYRFVCPNCGEEYLYDPAENLWIRIPANAEFHFNKNGEIIKRDEKPKQ